MTDKSLSSIDAAELARLITKATPEALTDGGRYFAETYVDLTRCRHEEIGEYQHTPDGALIEWLWNNRNRIVETIRATDPADQSLPMKLPLDSGPLNASRASVVRDVDAL